MALVEQQAEPTPLELDPVWAAAHRDVCGRLVARYDGRVDAGLVESTVTRGFAAFADARITLYVPLLVERAAETELRRHVAAIEDIRRL